MDRKLILWSLVLFFGCSILFRAIDSAVADATTSLLIQGAALVAIIAAIVLISRHRSK